MPVHPPATLSRRHLLGTALATLALTTGIDAATGDTHPVARLGRTAASAADAVATHSRAAAPQPAAPPVEIVMKEMLYAPAEATIPANTDVACTFTNAGVLPHDAVVPDTGIYTGILAAGASATVTINLPPGTYAFYCTQSGHRFSGMVGTLTVT